MARHGGKHQPGGRAGVFPVAGAEHQRQLGQGRAARTDAGAARSQRQIVAAAAARHERGGCRRHRPCTRRPAVSARVVLTAMASERKAEIGGHRGAITLSVILATLMQALDTTIANVSLPYMQGSMSASYEQIEWVLTSYIVAAAIMTPPTGFLAGKF